MEKILQTNGKCSNNDIVKIKYFDALLDSSIVSKSDLEGNITDINDNFTKVTGFSREEAIGKNHNILRHPDTPNSAYKSLWETIQKGEIWRERVLNKNRDGSDFWAETTIIPLTDEQNNKILEYIAIRRDITDFLHIKRELQKQKIEKEQRKKISEAKDSFLLLFSHELKTPLNAIINFTKYLLKHVSEETIHNIPLAKREKLLEQIEFSARKMLEDVTQLLELSKLQANKLYYNYSRINIYEMVVELLQDHESLAQEYGVEISFSIKCKTCYTINDLYRLRQILANVLSNAIKYSKDKVHVSVQCSSETCTVIFEDNGPGVKDKKEIFELFNQGNNDMKTKAKNGTGIGLYFLKLLCKDLKIDYHLEDSFKLGGLKFILYIPMKREKDDTCIIS